MTITQNLLVTATEVVVARCSFPGCESAALPNPADTENGPCAADLDPVFCSYHDAELVLIANIDGDVRAALGIEMDG